MDPLSNYFPNRIICLTEETTETLYLLSEQDRIIGISGFAVRPKGVRKEKPIISTFIDAQIDVIVDLKPDLVIGFSDIQADIARDLVAKGITVWINNYRSVEEIYKMIAQLGSLVGKGEMAFQMIADFKEHITQSSRANNLQTTKPKVYFEEWGDPLISGSKWVSELIELAGGIDIYKHKQHASLAKDRIIADPNQVVNLNPDIILASWCGKKFKKEQLIARENWSTIQAVKDDFVFEIKSPIILQPGPAALTDGFDAITDIITQWNNRKK